MPIGFGSEIDTRRLLTPRLIRSQLSIRDVRRCERNASTTGAAANDAGALVNCVEPIVEVQLKRFAVSLRCVARVLPMERATGLLAYCLTFKSVFQSGVLAGLAFEAPSVLQSDRSKAVRTSWS